MKAEEAMLMLKNFLDEDKFIVSKKFRDDLIYILKNIQMRNNIRIG